MVLKISEVSISCHHGKMIVPVKTLILKPTWQNFSDCRAVIFTEQLPFQQCQRTEGAMNEMAD